MEIPVINRMITNGDTVEMTSFPNPISTSLPSHFLPFPITQTNSFFKWSALVLALVASFTTLIKSIKVLVLNKSQHVYPSSQQPLISGDFPDSYSDSDSDSDEPSTSFSYSLWDSEKDDRGEEVGDEDFSVKGIFKDRWQNRNFRLRRRRNGDVLDLSSLFTTGKNVVKLWDNVGLGLGSLAMEDNDNVLSSLFSGNVVVSADRTSSGRLLKVWDTRVGCQTPPFGKDVVANSNGTGGVFVRDDVTGGLAVGDVRKVGSPLWGVADADVDAWWDAAAVIVGSEDSVNEFVSCRWYDSGLRRG